MSLRESAQHACLGRLGRVTSQIIVWNKYMTRSKHVPLILLTSDLNVFFILLRKKIQNLDRQVIIFQGELAAMYSSCFTVSHG